MMSAALLMLAGVEQTGKSVGSVDLSADQDKPEGISFAKSFSDRIDESASLQGESSAKDASIGLLRGSKDSVLTKKLNEVVATPGDAKELTHGVREIAAHKREKNAATSLGVAPQAINLVGSRTKAVVDNTVAKDVAPAVKESETTNDSSSNSPTSVAVLAVSQPSGDVVAPGGPTDKGWPSLSSAGSTFVPKQTESAGKTKEVASTRKTEKMSQNTAPSKTAQKAVGTDGNIASTPAEACSREDARTVSQAIVAGAGAPPKEEVSTNGNRLSETIAGRTFVTSGVPSATSGVVVPKEAVHETKAGDEDTVTAMSFADGPPALQKFGGELEKAATVAAASGPAMMTVHPAAGGMAAGVASLAIVSGNTPGETISTKPQVGDAGAHITGPTVETREQGGPGVISAPTDAIQTMLKATPTALEVGIQDGTHGWLKVRAEMADGGVVNASVSAASSTGQEMLHRELPAITAYLQQEKVAVNAIAVHTPFAAGAEPRSATGMDGSGGQTPQGHERGEAQQNIRKGLPVAPDEATSYQSLHGVDEDGSLSLATYASGGSWLSVRA